MNAPVLIAWTTTGKRADAEALAAGAVKANLAACAQVDGPIVSHYRHSGRLERAKEYRICFKLLPARSKALEAWILKNHPYAIPEWIAVQADRVSGKYLSWAKRNPINPPF